MRKFGNWISIKWQEITLFLVGTLLVIFVLWFRLGSLVPGLSSTEISQLASSENLSQLLSYPIGLPYTLLQFITRNVLSDAIGFRSASAVIGLITAGSFYYVLTNWYSRRIAILGSIMLLSSAWFLHTSRTGVDSSMYMLIFCSIACIIWANNSKRNILPVAFSTFLILVLLYIPGMIWLIIPVVLWQSGNIVRLLRKWNMLLISSVGILAILALAPLAHALINNPDLIRPYLGLSYAFPSPSQFIGNISDIPVMLFARGPNNPAIWLARLPLLNLFVSAMFVLGVYAYYKNRQLDRTSYILFIIIVGIILISLGDVINISLILPFVYLISAGGLAMLLQQWYKVFPRNPFARSAGLLILTIAILISAFQGARQYFIAWPHSPKTIQAHTKKS